ncbi:hypothetical protein [Henriciella litoralis]|uniref:hypothetical protein n=1 Tax=Henriciella litoralis TaxID=568102 RepID=UPI0009FBFF05|nr:hypothetical protein [Henriciella litoralis]
MSEEPIVPVKLDEASRKAQNRRNIWLALALFAFVVLVGVTTVIRLGDSDLGPDGGLYWRNDPKPQSQPAPELPENAAPADEGSPG